jgi:NAD-dependent dihydropyrimidine dehydrogenase PreA subunit
MAKRLTVVLSQGQSLNPAKRKLEEDIVAQLVMAGGVDVTVVPHLYDLAPDGTGMLCLSGIGGDLAVLSWLYPRAAHWTLDRNGIRGQFGATLLNSSDADDDEEDGGEPAEAEEKHRVVDDRPLPSRQIYCIDLRAASATEPFVAEVQRIAAEVQTQTVDLVGWIAGKPKPEQMERYLHGDGNGESKPASSPPATSHQPPATHPELPATLHRIEDAAQRRWYPVIDYSRCTNCMECIDFCLFGVYGVDRAETILVEQPDNCRKGCPACSRVCPENAIIFPQHKTPAIAGSPEVGAALKIDLSLLFGGEGGKSAIETAALERDEQLMLAGREAVGMTVGIPKRQEGRPTGPKDDLDHLIDALDEIDL